MGETTATPPALMPPPDKNDDVSQRIDAATEAEKRKTEKRKPKHVKRKHKTPQ
jgi:hypothetical protein